jgi:hypothetical protein
MRTRIFSPIQIQSLDLNLLDSIHFWGQTLYRLKHLKAIFDRGGVCDSGMPLLFDDHRVCCQYMNAGFVMDSMIWFYETTFILN